jgi:hydroxyacylglutathione hydrolase
MQFEQFYLGCLAHASYLLGSEGEAAIIDPRRDVDLYLKAAGDRGLKIRHIFETHLHADFVSGHRELAERTGAAVYIGAAAGAKFLHIPLKDGTEVRLGKVHIRVIETPGHTQESVCLIVTDTERSAEPWAIFTGDTLFVGDVGRPDLSRDRTPQELAGMLFDSVHEKVLKLPDSALVYPAHGAGSLCGKNMRAELFSTIGTERLTNYALQIKNREEFIAQLTANLPQRPDYFFADVELNRSGAAALEAQPLRAIPAAEVRERADLLLDTRPCDDFAAGHVPGSVNISLSGQFASWAGAVVGTATPIILVCESMEKVEESRLRLARVGIENIAGYLADGVVGWLAAGYELGSLLQIDVGHLREQAGELTIVDVRNAGEWESGHINGAIWYPLNDLARKPPAIPKDARVAVHCRSGYRSMIACSLLLRAGFSNVMNVVGGYDAWTALGARQAMSA